MEQSLELREGLSQPQVIWETVPDSGMPSDSTCVLEAEPGKLEIKIHVREPDIQFISLQADSLFKL